MSLNRIAVAFDDRPRPETTGFYVRRALQRLVPQVAHLRPDQLENVSPGEYDAFLRVDDGTSAPWPQNLGPTAWWAIDTHLDYPRALAAAEPAQVVFAAQRDGAERLRADGIATATWLPLACDPEIHAPTGEPLQWDWGFVGNLFPGPRTELLQALAAALPNGFAGRAYFAEMASVYSRCRLAFNRSLENDVNMRVFEALACGPLLLTNDLADNGLEELFQHERHLVTYHSAEELRDRARFYLAHESLRQKIATAGQALVRERHTYAHRVATMLQALEQAMSHSSVNVPETAFPKSPDYFEHARPEVVFLVSPEARTILDVGCGSGRLGQALKQRQPCEVWGLERDPRAVAHARQRLDRVLGVDLGRDDWELPEDYFDTVVCADVLEHLRYPEQVLRCVARALKPSGSLVVSLPNLQHHAVIRNLLDGHFTYESAGLLDEDHVRFFTRNEIEKLLLRCGFDVELIQSIPGPGWAEWERLGSPGEVSVGGLRISGLSREQAAAFFTYQYLIRATPTPTRRRVTSVILVTWNQLSYTRLCLDSLRLRTHEPIEIIVVDNASTDGTVEFLRAQPDIRLIENAENRGFPAAVNQGLAVARGEQLLLLNNDTIVTTGWLTRMLAVLEADPAVGLVGPVSNCVSGPQQVPVSYDDLSAIDGFAWNWGKQHHRERMEIDRLVGFCLLIRRETFQAIGGLDERFGIGNFEDDDYCVRARVAGYQTMVAVDSFVHHFGHRSFLASDLDFGALLAENQRKFTEKWAAPSPPVAPSARFHAITLPEGGLLLQSTRPKLSLCMIVRDNETTIGPCLESIRPWVDEMIVIDTGSTDATAVLCESLGATVHHWAWRDDFSAARNESLRYATGEWIFWMDSDDTISEECGRQLQALVRQSAPPHLLGFVMQVHCPGPEREGGRNVTVVDHVKVFRNRPDLRFEHRIHEQILPAIRRAGGDVAFTDIHVVHSGSDHSEEGKARKLVRDFRLLELDLQERPDHPFVLFNLGMTCADCGRYDEAIDYLNRCLVVSSPAESHVRKAYALLLSSLFALGDHETGRQVSQNALTLYPDDKELLFRAAMLAHVLGHLHTAASYYLRVLSEAVSRCFSSIDSTLATIKARHNLGVVYMDLHDFVKARAQWELILHDQPDYQPAHEALRQLDRVEDPRSFVSKP
jgi:GT2 family glycosyltransferase/2-polyprenyl-3-methyl-5-hydroxy-6-metoxy-1,4-benzoquinol methylase